MAGMDPMHYLLATDPFERRTMEMIASRRARLAEIERKDLADRIINTLGEAMKKK